MPPEPDALLVASLEKILGTSAVLTDAQSLDVYGGDWTRGYPRRPSAVALPKDIESVQAVVQLAAREGVAIVPSGGRTGLSGGAVAARGELVLALDRLNSIDQFNPLDRTVRCGAGVVTAQLQQFAAEKGLYYPVDFASSGSSQIGGNIATNAGGIKVLRYGSTRDWVAGMKVVTGTGELLDCNRGLVKNNTGYDLRHLLIGSEGTLGIVVEATLRLTTPPSDLVVVLLGVPELPAALAVLAKYREAVALTACELFSEAALQKVVAEQGLERPTMAPSPYYVLLEFESGGDSGRDKALGVFADCVAAGLADDGVLSQSEAQALSLWRLREDISESLSRWSPYKNDIATVVSRIPECVRDIEAVLVGSYPDYDIVWFGHIGDGNLHLNVLKPEEVSLETFQRHCDEVSKQVFAIVARYGGSISAEHGVGLLKKDYLGYTRSESEIAIMKQIKRVFDPRGILNPGKIFD